MRGGGGNWPIIRWMGSLVAKDDRKTEEEIPKAPPPKLREPYLALSWSYLYWCVGMLIWSILCVSYFIITEQRLEMFIGICLGVMMIAMIVLPAVLFGGETWYKRLAWITVLEILFCALFFYPVVVIVIGIVHRAQEGRYSWPWGYTHWWHMILSAMTLLLEAWTARITVRSLKLVRVLARGDWH